MANRPRLLYFDTSVYGGCFDAEFAADSRRVIEYVEAGLVTALIRTLVLDELSGAPAPVIELVTRLPRRRVEVVELTLAARELADEYMRTARLAARMHNDALHVAVATIARADALVSWNFHDLVRLDRMSEFNSVNLTNRYAPLSIVSPQEVRFDE